MLSIKKYKNLAKKVRKEILEMIYRTKGPHIGSSFSIVEILIALYFEILAIDPKNPFKKNRDIFILSKGHSCPAFYSVLAERGFLDKELLKQFAINNGRLGQHPDQNIKNGIEISTGSLGHGLSIGAGLALAAKYEKSKRRVFVLLGDGELDEGTNWEAILFSSHHRLDNLIAIVDYNKFQILGTISEILALEPLKEKWLSFGWAVKKINGHNFDQIFQTFKRIPFQKNKPSVVITHTIKGKGVSFMENNNLWHSKFPNEEEYKKALAELK